MDVWAFEFRNIDQNHPGTHVKNSRVLTISHAEKNLTKLSGTQLCRNSSLVSFSPGVKWPKPWNFRVFSWMILINTVKLEHPDIQMSGNSRNSSSSFHLSLLFFFLLPLGIIPKGPRKPTNHPCRHHPWSESWHQGGKEEEEKRWCKVRRGGLAGPNTALRSKLS